MSHSPIVSNLSVVNRLALQVIQDCPFDTHIFVVGRPGSGKTTLLRAFQSIEGIQNWNPTSGPKQNGLDPMCVMFDAAEYDKKLVLQWADADTRMIISFQSNDDPLMKRLQSEFKYVSEKYEIVEISD